ncbi:MAG: sensor histidine kinase [Oscillospiraceae bacterium]
MIDDLMSNYQSKIDFLCKVYEKSPTKIIIANEDLQAVWFNQSVKKDDNLYKNVLELSTAIEALKDDELMKHLNNGKGVKINHSFARNDNFNLDLTPVCENGKMIFCVITIADVFVSDILGEKDIKIMAENMSASFRKPISVMFSAIGPITRKFEEAEDYAGQEYVKTIAQNCYLLLKNSINMSDIIKYNNNDKKLKINSGDLNDFLENLCSSANFLVRDSSVTIEFVSDDNPLFTAFDADKLTYAIANIILNSCLYTKEKNKITITLKKIKSNAIITIIDRGVGMSSEELSHLFSPYYSKIKCNLNYNSLGLGMPLVMQIIKLHGGQIAASSIEGEGSSISMTIPIIESDDIPSFSASVSSFLDDKFSPLYIVLSQICSKTIL